MKSIALLTMLVLPGTFISTLFSVPLFNWDAESWQDVPKSRFWFYWAITIPLTLTIVLVWIVWQRSWNKHNIELDRKARDSAEYASYAVDHTSLLDDSNRSWDTLRPPIQAVGGLATLRHRSLRDVGREHVIQSWIPARTNGSTAGSDQRDKRIERDERRMNHPCDTDVGN
jgi:hypothetical protein